MESIRRDENRVLPISTLLQDWHGITDVCMSVPTLVNARGAGQRLEVPLDDGQLARLTASADAIRASPRNLGLSRRRAACRVRGARERAAADALPAPAAPGRAREPVATQAAPSAIPEPATPMAAPEPGSIPAEESPATAPAHVPYFGM